MLKRRCRYLSTSGLPVSTAPTRRHRNFIVTGNNAARKSATSASLSAAIDIVQAITGPETGTSSGNSPVPD
jgi:hypothetical protein